MLPNLIIPGAPKSGTSTLYRWLSDHPAVQGARLKEVEFFIDLDWHSQNEEANAHSANLDAYERFFDGWTGTGEPRLIVESTPAYMYQQTALRDLPDLPSKPHLLFLVREPAAQIKSTFDYFQNNWQHIPADWAFADYVAALEAGRADFSQNELVVNALDYARYDKWLDKWRDAVGTERMTVLGMERFFSDARSGMVSLCDQFGLDPGFYDSYDFPRENETYRVKSQALQSLNVRVRALLPRNNALYNGLRAVYRKVNTGSKQAIGDDADGAAMDRLKARYAALPATLAQTYGLDLSHWR